MVASGSMHIKDREAQEAKDARVAVFFSILIAIGAILKISAGL